MQRDAPAHGNEAMLRRACPQVYPEEVAEPSGLLAGTTLRPYQRQSLAFMLNVEKNGIAKRTTWERAAKPKPTVTDDDEVTIVEAGKSKASSKSKTSSSAAASSSVAPVVRSGWLCDEMGMGKTMVCTSIILANPLASYKPVSDKRFAKLKSSFDPSVHPIPLKLTLIIVNNTLVKQWYDEVKKYAPGLNVHQWYNDLRKKETALEELRDADVLITTPHMILPYDLQKKISFHRLIMDESHLLASGSGTTSGKLNALQGYQATLKWAVTGTPCSMGLSQLNGQAKLLGLWEDGIQVGSFAEGDPDEDWTPPTPPESLEGKKRERWVSIREAYRPRTPITNQEVVDRLRSAMIRHTKVR